MTSTSAVSTATVLKVPLNSSITTTATLVQSNGANPVGPRDAVSVDQKDGHLDVQVSTDSNRGNQLLVCDDHNDGHPRNDPPAGYVMIEEMDVEMSTVVGDKITIILTVETFTIVTLDTITEMSTIWDIEAIHMIHYPVGV